MEEKSNHSDNVTTTPMGEEVAQYGADTDLAWFCIALGLIALVVLPAFFIRDAIRKDQWIAFCGGFAVTSPFGVAFVYFGIRMFRVRCTVYRHGVVFRGYGAEKAVHFDDVASVKFNSYRGVVRVGLVTRSGSEIWLHHLEDCEVAGEQIANLISTRKDASPDGRSTSSAIAATQGRSSEVSG